MVNQVKKVLLSWAIVWGLGLCSGLMACQGRHEVKVIDLDQDILWYLDGIDRALNENNLNTKKIDDYITKAQEKLSYYFVWAKYRPSSVVTDKANACISKVSQLSCTPSLESNNQDLEGIKTKLEKLVDCGNTAVSLGDR